MKRKRKMDLDKDELEAIAFAEIHKEAHDSIIARLNFFFIGFI